MGLVCINFVGDPCIHVPQTTYMSCNSTGDGKGLEIYKGHSPLASGVRQAPNFTYNHSATSTKHKHCTHKDIANTYDQVPVKPHHTHICQVQQVLAARGACQAPQYPTAAHRLEQGSDCRQQPPVVSHATLLNPIH